MSTDIVDLPKKKHSESIRCVTFNVNGIRTFFHFHPFSKFNQSLSKVFQLFDTDIITFQELKTDQTSLIRWGQVDGYYSFISIPITKKGYAGVGCWIRIPPPEDPLYNLIKVVKAEEGITGYLTIRNGKLDCRYRDCSDQGIGGYDSLGLKDETEALKLDSEGRCVLVELACNIVVVSVYCPANSTQTEEGELFRLKFLSVLFKRIRNLDTLGKKVILMGDLNVCKDLIDHAEILDKFNIEITNDSQGSVIERTYDEKVHDFIWAPDAPQRRMLNQILSDSLDSQLARTGILVDSTRVYQGRDRLKIYTVWNTLKNARPINYGSRIDYVFISSKLKNQIKAADILPKVLGSDHCPVYADIGIETLGGCDAVINKKISIPKFEARYKYKLQNHDILTMFHKNSSQLKSKMANSRNSIAKISKPYPQTKVKKTVKSIDLFFTKDTCSKVNDISSIHSTKENSDIIKEPKKAQKSAFKNIFGEIPLCNHQEKAILKTSRTSSNPGKKFWACSKPQGESKDKNSSCGFFQWV
ncbi:hypothetical protein TBLA_0A08780 [Henningerozyma blattae CBS 6284]|uniref:DNA-(apurinic or apyrimidinic site) endonuclease 2 n=1 Tax=Henningerozyma blattae (strain ATCC 34711 / CBS 6284 / DSM 70876 / NBRC 10599 / NRRL Y-10934 / UCD 77-7) TaxID=1071380 RepID=I2GX15_HENB6|nr:hypothetical protein TBLA_0A08780 [Tetrapisispora blattae CBS 6284]CCH58667.1 hypothetical protein TBLA_0A08780 [Tetrapisispora blattae CBS 6284]